MVHKKAGMFPVSSLDQLKHFNFELHDVPAFLEQLYFLVKYRLREKYLETQLLLLFCCHQQTIINHRDSRDVILTVLKKNQN